MSATVAAAVKAAIVILSNEEARKKVGWGIVAILSPLIVLVVLLCAILSGTSQHNVSAVELCFHGGSISAITLNTPGTNSAIATTFDGYPLAKKGKVKKALDTSLFASVFGGLFSAVLLLLCASLITKLVANFTSVEYFSLGIMGISLIAGVSGSSLPKSLISGMIGLLMACIGMDAVTGVTRFSFGSACLLYTSPSPRDCS
mgnify:FL=1